MDVEVDDKIKPKHAEETRGMDIDMEPGSQVIVYLYV